MQAPGWVQEQRIPAALEYLREARARYDRSPNAERQAAVIRAEAALNDLLELLYAMNSDD